MIEWCKMPNRISITEYNDNLLYIKQSCITFTKEIVENFKNGNSQKQIRVKFGVKDNNLIFCFSSVEGYKMSIIPYLSVCKGLRAWLNEHNIKNGIYKADWNEAGYYECERMEEGLNT